MRILFSALLPILQYFQKVSSFMKLLLNLDDFCLKYLSFTIMYYLILQLYQMLQF